MTESSSASAGYESRTVGILLGSVFVVAICGLVYELIAGALASYLLGDSITQFSIVIGVFLTSMGVGSFLSRFVRKHLLFTFVAVEIGVGLVGGFSALLGFAAFAYLSQYSIVLLGSVVAVGVLVGLEIPLVLRILKETDTLRVTAANVLGLDYFGALVASMAFPFFLLPVCGIVRSGLFTGLLNLGVGAILLRVFGPSMKSGRRWLWATIFVGTAALIMALVFAGRFVSHLENRSYQDEVIFAKTSAYQRIVLTRWRGDLRLYLNGHLQFSSVDEYRYHEALAHPALASAENPRQVLILGGGDGLLAREVLKHPGIQSVTIVDLDAAVTDLFKSTKMLTDLNHDSLNDARVRIVNEDAFKFLDDSESMYDVVLADLPDPSTPALSKLYSRSFYTLIGRHLADGGTFATQATSPFRSREAFWCIAHTLDATPLPAATSTTFQVAPYQLSVPTFGTWGFVLASRRKIRPAAILLNDKIETRFLTESTLPSLFVIPKDMGSVKTPINLLNDPCIGNLYRRGYNRYLH
ncbi:MAG: polyamine aminopropyltransferase [Planctomycetota bacterium]